MPVSVRVLGWHLRLVLVVWARLASRVLLVWRALVVRVARVWVVSRPRWLPVPVVLAVALVVLVVWRARLVPVPVLVVGVDPVRTVRVVACRVMRTRVLRVLLLVVRWVLARALPVLGLVLVWALVVVLQVLARVCQVLQARYQVRQRPLVPVRVRPVVVAV